MADCGPGSDEDSDDRLSSMSTLEHLPRELKVAEFAKERARELACLTACVEVTTGNKRIFQQLPRHMRRRAQSYNVKRVPRRIQEAHRRELEKVCSLSANKKKAKKKTASRRHRRRPVNLLLDYNRRQKKFIWLETHIWHAKRFRMCQRWGYKIPLHPCDKSVRACYRGATRAALLQDLSYLCCIEISGLRPQIIDVLRQMTSAKCGLTFESARHESGESEGRLVLYGRNKYPHAAIGEAKFIWRPRSSIDDSAVRQLWIWVHPACHEQVLAELIDGFKLRKNIPEEKADEQVTDGQHDPLRMLKDKAFLKLEPKLKPFYERTPLYVGDVVDSGVKVKVLKDNLVRLRLVGQMSTVILTDVLRLDVTDDQEEVENEMKEEKETGFWWLNPRRLAPTAYSAQCELWKDVGKAPFSAQFPPNCVVGLTVRDPREFLRADRSKIPPEVPDACRCEFTALRLPSGVADSPLWDQQTRDEVTFSKRTDQDLNKLRSKHLVPGTPLKLGDRGSRIPLILVQNPGNQIATSTSEVGMGWDVILPAGWAMPFWIALVYRNARVGGLRELAAGAHQSQTLHFPNDFPDSLAGQEDEADARAQLTTKYFAYPPDKRPNYIKMGIVAPFHSPWKILADEWAKLTLGPAVQVESEDGFYVMREQAVLRLLRRALQSDDRRQRSRQPTNVKPLDAGILTPFNSHSVLPIRLKMSSKGILSQFALVCLPSDLDLRDLDANSSFCCPREPSHRDETKACRARIKKECRKPTKKKKNKKPAAEIVNPLEAEMKERLEELRAAKHRQGQEQIKQLCIPPVVESVVKTCSRDIIGFVKCGGFSYVDGCVTGLAFVSLPPLVNLIVARSADRRKPMVLVRETNSDQYRFASFQVL